MLKRCLTCVSVYSIVSVYSNVSMDRYDMKEIKELSKILGDIQEDQLIERFFKEILTPYEIKEISDRWALVKLLEEGMSQRKIARKLGISLCKITRGSRELKRKNSALKRIIREYIMLDTLKVT